MTSTWEIRQRRKECEERWKVWNWRTDGDTRLQLLLRPAFQPSTPTTIRYHISHHVSLSLTFDFDFFVFVETPWYQYSNGGVKVLIYGRERSVILEAVAHDKHCVLANILAAHFLHSSGSSRALTCLHAAKSHLVPSHLLLFLFCFSDSIHQIQKQNTK